MAMESTNELFNIVATLDKDAINNYLQNNKYNNIEIKKVFKMLVIDTDDNDMFDKKMDCLSVVFNYMSNTLTIYNKLSECSFLSMHFAFKHSLYSPAQFFFKQKHFTKIVYQVFKHPKWRKAILKTHQAKAKQKCVLLLLSAVEQITFIGKEDYDDWESFKDFLKISKEIKVKISLDKISKNSIIERDTLVELLELTT